MRRLSALACASTAFLRPFLSSAAEPKSSSAEPKSSSAEPRSPEALRVLEELSRAAPPAAPPPLVDLIRCCDALAGGPLCSAEEMALVLRAMASAPGDSSQEPWASALRLMLRPRTTEATTTTTTTATTSSSVVEVGTAPCITKDTEMLTNETVAGVPSHAQACEAFLMCCVRHGAPLHVCRAAYATLRIQYQSKDMTPMQQPRQWHFAYARALLQKSTSRDAQREALCVLLIDAPADNVAVRPVGLLLALDLLRAVAVDEHNNFSPISETPNSRTGAKHKHVPTEQNTSGDARNMGIVLWDTLCSDLDAFVAVATDICRAILTDPTASTKVRQEAIYRFAIIAGICSNSPSDLKDHDYVDCVGLIVPFMNALTGLLADCSYSREMILAMSTPRQSAPREARFLAVTLVTGVMRQLRILHTRAVRIVGPMDAVGSSDSLELWRVGSAAALSCLRRILMNLPPSRKAARQKAFCCAFQGVLDGVFYTDTESPAAPAQRAEMMDVMATLAQMYAERDWHEPSVGIYIECLCVWRRFNEMRRVFSHLYRRDTRAWRSYRQAQEEKEMVGKETDPSLHTAKWSTSLSLPTCQRVVHAACEAGDPAIGAMAIKQMLRCLLVAKSEQDTKEELLTLSGDSVAQWTRRVRDDLIPMVDKEFCRTQQDTEQKWLRDIQSN